MSGFHNRIFLLFLFSLFSFSSPCLAENNNEQARPGYRTLDETLRYVHETNPTLRAARQELHAAYELYPQALAGWRPTINASTSIFHGSSHDDFSDSNAATKDLTIDLEQPLYRGGKTTAEIEQAKK